MGLINEILKDNHILSTIENNNLALEAKDSKEAMERFVGSNILVAIKIIKQLNMSVTEDSIQAAIVGLILAVRNFDSSKGNITTYLRYWVINELMDLIDSGKALHYTNAYKKNLRNYEGLQRGLQDTGIDESDPAYKLLLKANNLTPEKMKSIEKIRGYTFISYDDYDSDQGRWRNACSELLADGKFFPEDVIAKVFNAELCKKMEHILNTRLTEKERIVIKKYYGFGCEPMNYSEIGREMGVTREAVRIKARNAISKLARSSELREMFYDL